MSNEGMNTMTKKTRRQKPTLVIEILTPERLEFVSVEVTALLKKMGEPMPKPKDTPND